MRNRILFDKYMKAIAEKYSENVSIDFLDIGFRALSEFEDDECEEALMKVFCMRGGRFQDILSNLFLFLGETDVQGISEVFKQGIVAAIKAGKRPTRKIIENRRPQIKKLSRSKFNKMIKMLAGKKEIKIDSSGKNTAYLINNFSCALGLQDSG